MMTTTSEAGAAGLRISLITVAWNHREEVDRFLAAISESQLDTHLSIELVLVDNNSTDDTAEYIASRHPWVVLVRNTVNAGFAQGCNDGLAKATGDFLMLLNPDAYANAGALRGMAEFLRARPDVGAVGCLLLHDDGLPQFSHYGEVGATTYLLHSSMFYPVMERLRKQAWRLGFGRSTAPQPCDWLMGSCIMVRRDVYNRAGGLEPAYFMYSEDADWCRRIRDAGFRIFHLPGFSMQHSQKGSSRKRREFTFRRLYRNIVMYSQRHLSTVQQSRLKAMMIFDFQCRLIAYRILGLLKAGEREALGDRVKSVRLLLGVFRSGNIGLIDEQPPT